MSIYSSPPPARSFRDEKSTLLVCWWCTVFAAVIILFRVAGRYIRSERLFREDWLAFGCMIPLLGRMGLVHVILLYGTNNAITTGLSEHDIDRRMIGSRLVLASRIFQAATLWMLKLTISEFFKRHTLSIWRSSHERMLHFIRWFLLVTFVAIFLADITECHPVTHYWQVVPDPGPKCRQGYAQLITMGAANVITDILLVIFPIPIIIRSKMGLKRKIQLVLLFSASLLPAGTTLYRIPHIIDRHGSQQYRSLLASVEILFATAVANALILGSFVRDKGIKKQRWKYGSVSDSMDRTASRRGTVVRAWGSDEDLVRDLGLNVDPELRGSETRPRPAPVAAAGKVPLKAQRMGLEPDWQFPKDKSEMSEKADIVKTHEPHSPSEVSSVISPRKVSFFDVGGLLEEQHSPRRSSTRTTDTDGESSSQAASQSHDHNVNGLSPAPPRRGSTALLQDVGGLLGPRTRGQPRGFELQTILREEPASPPPQPPSPVANMRRKVSQPLQDVGGLLR